MSLGKRKARLELCLPLKHGSQVDPLAEPRVFLGLLEKREGTVWKRGLLHTHPEGVLKKQSFMSITGTIGIHDQ